jgi:hypothetical protein
MVGRSIRMAKEAAIKRRDSRDIRGDGKEKKRFLAS